MAESSQPPVAQFTVPGADLNHFYDGFLNNGNIVFLSATPDGHFDNTRVHLLNLNSPQHVSQFGEPTSILLDISDNIAKLLWRSTAWNADPEKAVWI